MELPLTANIINSAWQTLTICGPSEHSWVVSLSRRFDFVFLGLRWELDCEKAPSKGLCTLH